MPEAWKVKSNRGLSGGVVRALREPLPVGVINNVDRLLRSGALMWIPPTVLDSVGRLPAHRVKPMPIPVYVINLDRRGDRMARMSERLAGISHARVSAVSGDELGDWPVGLDLPTGSTLNRYEYACSQSHLKAAMEVVARQHPYACVLEDDVLLSADFHRFVESADWIPEGLELIKCETMACKVWLGRAALAAGPRSLHPLKSFHPGTAGYFISQQGARKLVKLLSGSMLAVDDLMFDRALHDKGFGEVWQLVPAICMQEFIATGSNADSDIENSRAWARAHVRKRPKVLQRVIREFRRPLLQLMEIKRRIAQRRMIVPME